MSHHAPRNDDARASARAAQSHLEQMEEAFAAGLPLLDELRGLLSAAIASPEQAMERVGRVQTLAGQIADVCNFCEPFSLFSR